MHTFVILDCCRSRDPLRYMSARLGFAAGQRKLLRIGGTVIEESSTLYTNNAQGVIVAILRHSAGRLRHCSGLAGKEISRKGPNSVGPGRRGCGSRVAACLIRCLRRSGRRSFPRWWCGRPESRGSSRVRPSRCAAGYFSSSSVRPLRQTSTGMR